MQAEIIALRHQLIVLQRSQILGDRCSLGKTVASGSGRHNSAVSSLPALAGVAARKSSSAFVQLVFLGLSDGSDHAAERD
jgi:hypothetical protein